MHISTMSSIRGSSLWLRGSCWHVCSWHGSMQLKQGRLMLTPGGPMPGGIMPGRGGKPPGGKPGGGPMPGGGMPGGGTARDRRTSCEYVKTAWLRAPCSPAYNASHVFTGQLSC